MRLRVQRALEEGRWDGPLARLAADVWRAHARVTRCLVLPPALRVVGVGGATLGGSGRTPLVLELARRAPAGLRVAVLAQAYPRRAVEPRLVGTEADPERAGDEAVMLARLLEGTGVAVWIGNRKRALDRLASDYDIVIVDGLLQTEPEPLHCSVLALDGVAPWGAGRCPPAGDLKAEPCELLGASDLVVVMQPPGVAVMRDSLEASVVVHPWAYGIVGARPMQEQRRLSIAELARLRLGLLLALGRPRRVLAELAALGIFPELVVLRPDHGGFPRDGGRPSRPLDAWLTTAKCATKLENSYAGTPVWVLQRAGELPETVVSRCFGRASLGDSQPW